MRDLLKVFLYALAVQALFLLIALSTGLGDGIVYIVYGIPFFILDSIVTLPKHDAGNFIAAFGLFCLPAALYSAIFAIGWRLLKHFWSN